MYRCKTLSFFLTATILLSLVAGCSQVTGDLDDQSPVLFVNIELDDPALFTIDDAHQIYLVYYVDSDWTNPWLTHGAPGTTLINPVVGTFSTHLAAYYDANGNGVLDTGDPCTGYKNAKHPTDATADDLSTLTFLPLEWMTITISLVFADQYGN